MITRKYTVHFLLIFIFLSTAIFAQDDVRYVTDEFEITLHRKMNLNSDVVAELKSGTPVKVLRANRDEGFVMVATGNEKVGWMLESYLLDEPVGRQKYEALKKEYDKLKTEFDAQLQKRTLQLSTELNQVKKISKRPLELEKENQQLKDLLQIERDRIDAIKQENRAFKSIHKDRQWLVTGAVIAIGSLVLGLIITKIPWRRRKSWGEL